MKGQEGARMSGRKEGGRWFLLITLLMKEILTARDAHLKHFQAKWEDIFKQIKDLMGLSLSLRRMLRIKLLFVSASHTDFKATRYHVISGQGEVNYYEIEDLISSQKPHMWILLKFI